jgi:broad specificity phosphatase PhoE
MSTFVTLLLAMLAGAATPSADVAADIYVARHLNTPAGQRDPDLLPEGRRTALALAGWFDGKPLAAIYVTDFRRTRETVAPLAARRGLTPIVYDPGDVAGLVVRVRAAGGPVLIVGHSNTVGGIVAALGGVSPGELAHDQFGDIWRVAPDGATARARMDD